MDKQTTMYRRPSDPGFLGSYDWRSTTLGFLLITLSSFIATEYIAKEFRFSPALGAPLLDPAPLPCTSLSNGSPGAGGIAPLASRGFGNSSSTAR